MLFSIAEFEHYFTEATLKKGLRHFDKGRVERVSSSARPGYHFLVREQDLFLKKKGDGILSFTCSCSAGVFCEHLAAVLFFLNRDSLQLGNGNNGHMRLMNFGTHRLPEWERWT